MPSAAHQCAAAARLIDLAVATVCSVVLLLDTLLVHSALSCKTPDLGYLSFATAMLWPCVALSAAVGYISYKRREFRLEQKLTTLWRDLGLNGRLDVQAGLTCCGLNE